MILVDELNLAEDAVLERLNRWGWRERGRHGSRTGGRERSQPAEVLAAACTC